MLNRETLFRIVLAVLGVVWLFVVTLNYYVVHKPFGLENALAVLSSLGDILVATAIFALAAGLGRRLLRSFSFASSIEAMVFQIGMGLGIISFSVFALGLLGLLNGILFWVLLLLVAILLRGDLVALWRDMRALRLPIDSRFERALATFVGIALVLAFLAALTPPTAWDAQTYHLVEGQTAIEQGRIASPPDIVYFSFPSLVEMLFLAAMVLKGDIVTQVIHFGFLLLTLGAVFASSQRFFNVRVAWLAIAILVAVPTLLIISTWAYVDVALVCYAFVALYALLLGFESGGNWRWFALSGAMAGLALGVKYTSVSILLGLGLLLIIHRAFDFRHWVPTVGLCALFAAPWYVRNLVFTGNPFYPFVFGGPHWDSFRTEWFSRFGTGLLNQPLQILTAPWDATILGVEGTVSFDATIGSLLLALLPLLVFTMGKFRSVLLRDLMIFSAVLYLFWLLGLAESKLLLQTRLLFPAFPVFALAASVALDRLDALDLPQFSLQRFARLFILLVLSVTAASYILGFLSDNPLAYLLGFESREAFLSQHLGGYYSAMQFVNENLPPNSKTLFLWEPRSYYAGRVVQPDAILDAFADRRSKLHDADSITAALSKEGYTHILLSRAGLDYQLQTGYDPISSDDIAVLTNLMTKKVTQVYGKTSFQVVTRDGKRSLLDAQDDPYAIYEIAPPEPSQ